MQTQRNPIGNELKASVIQQNFAQLFSEAHDHPIQTSAPKASDGIIGDIYPAVINGTKYLYVKFTDGWFRTVLS